MAAPVGGRAGRPAAALARAPRVRAAARQRRALAARREQGEFGLPRVLKREKRTTRVGQKMRYESNSRILRNLRKCEGAAPLAAGRKRVNEARFATRRRARRKGARVPGPDLEVRAERRHLRLSRGHRFASARRGRARGRGRGARVANGHPAALGRLAVVAFPFRQSSVHARRVLEPRATRRLRAGRGDDESRTRERRRRHGAGFASCAVSARAVSVWTRRKTNGRGEKADSSPPVCREFC